MVALLNKDVNDNIHNICKTTKVYDYVAAGDWPAATMALSKMPSQAREWNILPSSSEENTCKDPQQYCRVLPIHTACGLDPPADVIRALLEAYPAAAKFPDNQGLYPLHYACGNYASADVVSELIKTFPEAVSVEDQEGMLALHHVCAWGASSVQVVDVILDACDENVLKAKDLDGNTALNLLYESNCHNEHTLEYLVSKLETPHNHRKVVNENVVMNTSERMMNPRHRQTSPNSSDNEGEFNIMSPPHIQKTTNTSPVSVIIEDTAPKAVKGQDSVFHSEQDQDNLKPAADKLRLLEKQFRHLKLQYRSVNRENYRLKSRVKTLETCLDKVSTFMTGDLQMYR